MSNKIKIQIWDRNFELNVVFQNFPGEEVTEVQENTISSITNSNIAESLNAVKEYIKKYNAEDLDDGDISNIFRYVMPKSIIIPRTKAGKRIFAIMCNYKFDMEHGLAIVFENEKYKSVGPQDIIL